MPSYAPFLSKPQVLQAPDGGEGSGGAGGASGAGNDSVKGEENKAEERFALLEKAVGLLARGNQEVTNGLSQLATKIEQIGIPSKDDKGSSEVGEDDADLETMNRQQFAAHLMKQLRGVVEESVKPLGEKFGQLDEKIDGQSLSVIIKDFSKDHPDFFEWKDEIRALVKENPTLTPARLYTLARSEHHEKARKLDEKYGLNKQASKTSSEDIFSLFPSSGGSATKGNGKMTPTQAAEAAWDSVMSQIARP